MKHDLEATYALDHHDRLLATVFTPVVLCLLLYLNFFHWRANVDSSKPDAYEVLVRFWMQPNMALHVLLAIGMSSLMQLLAPPAWEQSGDSNHSTKRRGVTTATWATVVFVALLIGAVLITVHSVREKYDVVRTRACFFFSLRSHTNKHIQVDESHSEYFDNLGRLILDTLPHNAIVLVRGDAWSSAIRYVQSSLGTLPASSLLTFLSFPSFTPSMCRSATGCTCSRTSSHVSSLVCGSHCPSHA